jgi:hypothetical protein
VDGTLTAGLLIAGPSGDASPATEEATAVVALSPPRAVEEAESAGAAAPLAGSTTQESDFELGIEDMLRGLELHLTPERRGWDGSSSREAPRAGPGARTLTAL